jgi:hypothetical protein
MKRIIPFLLATALFAVPSLASESCCKPQAACCQPAQSCCAESSSSKMQTQDSTAQKNDEFSSAKQAQPGAQLEILLQPIALTKDGPNATSDCCSPPQACCSSGASCCSEG